MIKNKKLLWVTNTAIFTALLIVWQMATTPLGNTLITGPVVNLILIISVMLCGLSSGLTVAVISPVMAKVFGIGPSSWMLIPFIIAGNIVLVLIWHLIGNREINGSNITPRIIALILAALAKFSVLYFGIVKIAVPLILNLPEPQASLMSNIFSIPQLITAALGGVLATLLLPLLEKAVNYSVKSGE